VKRVLLLAAAATALAGLTGCGSSQPKVQPSHPPAFPASGHVSIPADKPPSPTTWPKYPRFTSPSCWARPFTKGEIPEVDQVAPSYLPARRAHPAPPAQVAERLLARFGDHRYVRGITFTKPPAAVGSNVHVYYAGGHPPAGALEARISAPLANARNQASPPTPAEHLVYGIADFEAEIVGGALRDDLCDAGGAPLVMWLGDASGISDRNFALDQRFPNPSPAAFRRRVALVGRRFGFRVVSLLLLRPRQLAPALVVETDRPRKAFAKDIPRINDLLDPSTTTKNRTAQTFEAFFLAAEDKHGRPFLFTEDFSRGEAGGGEWAANQCLYPYPTLGPVLAPGKKQKPCT
jgi:hypothetical protein